MEWTIEEDEELGITWITNELGENVCDLYYLFNGNSSIEDVVLFDNAKEHAKLIIKAPQQQALIDELCEALRWIVEKTPASAWACVPMDRAKLALAKAERKEEERWKKKQKN